MERRESGKENVELAVATRFGDCTGHVRILEDQRRLFDLEMIERASGRAHGSSDVSLPVVRERFAIQRAQQVEVHRRRLQLHVLDSQNVAARLERHVPEQPRARRPHVHVCQDVVEILRVALTTDVELHLAATGRR